MNSKGSNGSAIRRDNSSNAAAARQNKHKQLTSEMDSIFKNNKLKKQASDFEDYWSVLGSEECRWSTVKPDNTKAKFSEPFKPSHSALDEFDFHQPITRRSALKRASHVRNQTVSSEIS